MRDTRDLGAGAAVAAGAAATRLATAVPWVAALLGVVLLVLGAGARGAVAVVLVVAGAVLVVAGAGAGVASRLIGSPARLAARVGGRPVDGVADAGLVSTVDGLCAVLGVREPELRVLDDTAANAIVLGAGAPTAVLVVTTGLLALLDRIELEGLVAHELAHARRGDLERASAATRALGLVALTSGAAARLVRTLAGPDRESFADLRAVNATRYPPGLASALHKIADAPVTRPGGLDTVTARLTAALWCAPLEEAVERPPRPGVLDVGERASALDEL